MRDHLPEVRVIVNGRFPQERNIAAFRGLPKREVEGEDFRGAQTISHPCSELQASQVLPTVLITYFALFRISDNASASCLFNFYPKLFFFFFFLYLGGKSQMINGRGPFWPRSVRVPRGRAEILGRRASAQLLLHGDADSHFEDFCLGNCYFTAKRGRKEEGARF